MSDVFGVVRDTVVATPWRVDANASKARFPGSPGTYVDIHRPQKGCALILEPSSGTAYPEGEQSL